MIFFFQAEDGIRDIGVTGVQTCALPIQGFIYFIVVVVIYIIIVIVIVVVVVVVASLRRQTAVFNFLQLKKEEMGTILTGDVPVAGTKVTELTWTNHVFRYCNIFGIFLFLLFKCKKLAHQCRICFVSKVT